MAYVDVAKFTAVSSGTGDFVVSAAVLGYQTPASANALDGASYYYRAESADLTQWEVGVGAYTASSTTIARTTVLFNSSGNTSKINFSAAPQVGVVILAEGLREKLTASLTLYVRTVAAVISFTAASANITWTGHGLSVNDPVLIDILPNRSSGVTITNANPGVVTYPSAHGFSAGQPIVFSSTGYLPPGVTAGTTYYVIATGLTSTQFQFSTTVGGAAVNTSKLTFTVASGTGGAMKITSSAANNLVIGQQVAVSSTTTLPTNLAASTTYYVAATPAPSGNDFYVSLNNGGTNVVWVDNGTGTHSLEQVGATTATNYGSSATHYCERGGAMPTFSTAGLLVAGTTYFVKTVVDANNITLSTTPGGTALGTATLATGSPVYTAVTGNDSNSGLTQTRSGALLTLQKACDLANSRYDFGGQSVVVQAADSTYAAGINITSRFLGAGVLTVQGNTTFVSNCVISVAGAVGGTNFSVFTVSGFKLAPAGAAGTSHVSLSGCALVTMNAIEWGATTGGQHAFVNAYATLALSGQQFCSGNATYHFVASYGGVLQENNLAVGAHGPFVLLNVPQITWVLENFGSKGQFINNTYLGSSNGGHYSITIQSSLQTNTGNVNYLPGNSTASVDGTSFVG